jgi:hypothetical protein
MRETLTTLTSENLTGEMPRGASLFGDVVGFAVVVVVVVVDVVVVVVDVVVVVVVVVGHGAVLQVLLCSFLP